MDLPRDAVLLRIFFGEADKYRALPLHEAIVLKAREMHLAGATVLRGQVGFGHSTRIHATKILHLSQDLPIIVEIVDSREKIDTFLPVLDRMMTSGILFRLPFERRNSWQGSHQFEHSKSSTLVATRR